MKHRHLIDGVGYNLASIEDILDRGSPDDWIELRAAVINDPNGSVADMVLEVCETTEIYGTSKLWPSLIRSLRQEIDDDSLGLPKASRT